MDVMLLNLAGLFTQTFKLQIFRGFHGVLNKHVLGFPYSTLNNYCKSSVKVTELFWVSYLCSEKQY